MTRNILLVTIAGVLAGQAEVLSAQADTTRRAQPDPQEQREREVRRARSGAGLRVGAWRVSDAPAGATASGLPAFEAYWQKGLDRHLTVESGVGFWQRRQEAGSDRISTYIIPLTSAIKLFPFSGPGSAMEPFLSAGVGFTLGIDDRQTATGGLLGGTASSGVVMIAGIGVKGQGGFEYRLGPAFGIGASVGYQYVRFFEEVGNAQSYQGLTAFGGLTYRFQF